MKIPVSVRAALLVAICCATRVASGQTTPSLQFLPVPVAIPAGTLAFADFNNDGKQDAVGLDSTKTAISVYPGNGDGTFASVPLQTLVNGNPLYSFANSKLIVANVHTSNTKNLGVAFSVSQFNASGNLLDYGVILGDGGGNGYFGLCESDIICLPSSPNYTVAPKILMLVAADFLHSGYVDIAFATQFPNVATPSLYDQSFVFYHGDGFGTMTKILLPQNLLPAQVSATFSNPSAMPADFLNNGFPYLLVNPGTVTTSSGTTLSGLALGLNSQYGTFTAGATVLPGVAVAQYLPVDVNADKKLDIVYTETLDSATPSTSIKAILGDGAGNFGTSMTLVSAPSGVTGTLNFQFVDLNNDGNLDIVFSGQSTGLYWASGNGDGTFNTPALITATDTLSSYASAFPGPPLLGPSTNFAWGQKAAYVVQVGPLLLVNPASTISFGSQFVGSPSAAQPATLTNIGDQPVTLSSIATSAQFTSTNDCGASLAPAASCTVQVSFSPTATGAQTGTLTVTDDAAGSPQIANLSGTGTSVSVASASGSSTSSTISNGGTATFVLALSPVAGFTGPLTVSCNGAPSGYHCSGSPSTVTLAGAAADVTFTVSPSTTAANGADPANALRPFRSAGTILLAGLLAGFLPRRHRVRFTACALVFLSVAGFSGCGGSSSPAAPTPVSNTYSLTAKFTTATGPSITQLLTLTINSK